MLKSLYSGVSGMRGFQTKLDVIGNNIANVNTVGFKSSRVMFKDILSQTVSGVTAPTDTTGGMNSKQIGLGVTVGAIDTIHTPGSAMTTNVPTDLRIDGDGFFAISPTTEVPDSPYLTRAGNFILDANRRLVTSDGMFVLSTEAAPIQLEDTVTSFSISQSGEIVAVSQDGEAAGTGQFIAVAKITNPAGLEKLGGNLYRITPNAIEDPVIDLGAALANDPATGTGAIVAGQLEMSNVDLTSEFTEMIVAQRGFQSNSRIITTSDEVLQEVVNLKR